MAAASRGHADLSAALRTAAQRCQRPLAKYETLHYEDVMLRDYASPAALEARGEQIYLENLRHPGAFYYSAQRESFIGRRKGEVEFEVPGPFIEALLTHLSMGLTLGYARSLYMADWGHGHLYIPWEEYRRDIEPLPASPHLPYEVLVRSPNLAVIYHAAEQMLKVVGGQSVEDMLSRRYIERRNILGSFGADPQTAYLPPDSGDPHNTQRELDGYREYGGIDFTWNRNACFPIHAGERVVYVDLSFESPPRRRMPDGPEP